MARASSKSNAMNDGWGRVLLPVGGALALTAALVAFTPLQGGSSDADRNAAPHAAASAAAGLSGAEIVDADVRGSRGPIQLAANTAAETVTDAGTSTATGAAAPIRTAQAGGFDAAQKSEIEGIVRSYLLANPEILLEMQQEFERRMEARRDEETRVALKTHAETLFRAPGSPTLGNPDGDVTVVEFFDYNCGFCRRALEHMNTVIEKDPNVRVVFKELPIFGQESEDAARAALAAGKQGKYWEMHRDLLLAPGRANKAKALSLAKKLSLDVAKLEADMQSEDVTREIRETQQLAEVMGIRGTPHFFVGDKIIPGAPEDLGEQILERVTALRAEGGCTVC